MTRLAELDEDERRLLGPYITSDRPSGGEWRAFCPECEDPEVSRTPSASFNFMRGEWHCMKNDCGGTINRLMRKLLKREKDARAAESGADVIDMNTRKKQPTKPLPTEDDIEGWCAQLFASTRLLGWLQEKRGLDEDTLRRFRIGYDSGRRKYTIPVYDADGTTLLNVRLYNPKARGETPKIMPFAVGYGTQMYNAAALADSDEVVFVEGEWDAQMSEQHGFPTVTHTGGAGAFQMAWVPLFKGKHVFLCFDEDEGGVKGATRTARMLRDVAAGIYIITGMNTGKKAGDVTDFYLGGGTAEHFRSLMDEARARPFAKDDSDHVVPQRGKVVSLEETQSTAYDEPLEVNVLIAGKQTPPYIAPKRVQGVCDQQKGKVCATCPMAAYNGDRTLDTHPDDPRLLQFVDSSDTSARVVLRSLFGAACGDRVEYNIMDQWSIEELIVVQSLENRSEETMNPMNRKVFNVGSYKSAVNTTARLVGHQVADPRNSRGMFHSWHLEPTASDIDDVTLTEDDMEALSIFQPDDGQSPLDKMREIATDLEANVTHIYGRQMMHVAYDVVWHSALGFNFAGKPMDKGWLEAVVMGDTRTGKSETAHMLCKHYKAGILKSCEGATFAGLVGGAQASPQGKGWMVTWGTIPLNDRRMVVLDELSGLINAGGESKGIIEQMSSIRSSGKAQLTKIVSEETSARTRLLWISNPVDGRRLADTPGGGMEALRKLVRNPEDVARFDFALAVSNSEVESSLINSMKHRKVPHVYTSDLCSRLLTWVWSRKADQVGFARGATQAVIEAAEAMGSRYVPEPPLVQVENIRVKLARIAVAIAARTFSTNANATRIVVTPAHVRAAVEFLDWVYGTETMGYLRASRRVMAGREEAARNMGKVTDYLRDNKGMLEALRAVMYAESFRPRDFEEFGGGEVDARSAVNLLLQWSMVRRLPQQGGRIVLEPPMIQVLKQLEDEGV